MPELPEVETVCSGLRPAIARRKLASIATFRRDLRIPFPKNLPVLKGDTVTAVTRRAKYALVHFTSGRVMIIHLGMSGRLTVQRKNQQMPRQKHDHMLMTFDNGTSVVFNDPRRFGLVDLTTEDGLAAHRFFCHLGPEPLDSAFNARTLAAALAGKKIAIKLAIMDQRVVVGVGNIYASEALYRAGIDPRRAAGTLDKKEIARLVPAIKTVLKQAIAAGGSSLRDYVQTDGELGYFQHGFKVYDRAGDTCERCRRKGHKKPCILKITQGGRSTFYCARQQQ